MHDEYSYTNQIVIIIGNKIRIYKIYVMVEVIQFFLQKNQFMI